jgi:hypothetical protein
MDDHDLQAAFRNRPPARRGWGCLDEESLAAYADARVEDGSRARIEAHLSECAFCRGQVAGLVKLSGQPLPEVDPALVTRAAQLAGRRKPARWRWAVSAAVAACALLALAPGLRREAAVPSPASDPGTRAVRKSPSTEVLPEIAFPREGATIGTQELEFRWNAVESALFYNVRIQGAEGDVLWTSRADGNHIRIPAGVLQPSRKYYLSVGAYLAQEKSIQLPTVGFQTTL